MRLREREQDPRVRRELEALDAALAGERVEPELGELAALAVAVRQERPDPDPDFAARLDAWAAEGFPSVAKATESSPAHFRKRPTPPHPAFAWIRSNLAPALGTAFVLLLMLAIPVGLVVTGTGGDDDSGGVDSFTGGGSAEVEPQSGDLKLQESAGSTRAARKRAQAGAPERVFQQRDAKLTLASEPGDVAEVADGVVEVTDRYDGIVDDSSVTTGADADARASFDLRIPSRNLGPTLADLSDLGHVKSRNETVEDVTKPYVRAEDRLADARAEVNALLAELEEASGSTEIASLREQLRIARAEQARARAQLAELKQRVGYSRVQVGIVSESQPGGWSIGDAADDAVGVLGKVLGGLLIGLAVIVPVGAILALLWLAATRLRRHSRERLLDAEPPE